MINRILVSTISSMSILFSTIACAYDIELAKSYSELFSTVEGAEAGKSLHFVKPEDFIKDIKAGKEIVAIDVRTESETELFAMTLPKSFAVPMNKIFLQENLERIPTDKPVMIICKSGARATAVGTALRHIGFDNVYILKGGFQSLSQYFGPKQAY